MDKSLIFKKTINLIEGEFNISDINDKKPWGGYIVIDNLQVDKFIQKYFNGNINGKLSPKILIVEPNKRLSWQYHNRRSEIWSIIEGPVGIIKSDTDIENDVMIYQSKSQIEIKKLERHRLIGLSNWGIVAELWRHTDLLNPTDENDIIRVQDDFSR